MSGVRFAWLLLMGGCLCVLVARQAASVRAEKVIGEADEELEEEDEDEDEFDRGVPKSDAEREATGGAADVGAGAGDELSSDENLPLTEEELNVCLSVCLLPMQSQSLILQLRADRLHGALRFACFRWIRSTTRLRIRPAVSTTSRKRSETVLASAVLGLSRKRRKSTSTRTSPNTTVILRHSEAISKQRLLFCFRAVGHRCTG